MSISHFDFRFFSLSHTKCVAANGWLAHYSLQSVPTFRNGGHVHTFLRVPHPDDWDNLDMHRFLLRRWVRAGDAYQQTSP